MLAEVFVDEFKTMAIIGCNPEERINKQPLLISFAYQYDISEAAVTDNVEAAIDYDDLCQKIARFIAESRFHLIETLADRLIDLYLNKQLLKIFLFCINQMRLMRLNELELSCSVKKNCSSINSITWLSWE